MGSRVELTQETPDTVLEAFDVDLPAELDRTKPIAEGIGQTLVVSDAEGPVLTFRTLEPMRCVVEDCRQWETYYYVIRFEAPMVGGQLAPGQTLEMGLDVAVRPTQDAGPPARTEPLPELTADRSMVQLEDDETTCGDWETTYGSEAYVLWGMTGAHLCGGAFWPLPVRAYTGDPDQRIARWMSKLRELHDRRALLCPKYRDRRPSIIDDTGESRPLGGGPDLLVDFSVPPGDHALSLYWFEIDYPQYRDYKVEFSDRAGKRLLATDARDFYNGVYKRFAVRGPQELTVRIRRSMSINATLSGLFLDPLAADWRDPACANPVAHLRERGIQQVEGQSPELARVYDLLRQRRDREAEALCRDVMQGDGRDPTAVFAAELAYTLRTSREDFGGASGVATWLLDGCSDSSPGRAVGVKAGFDRMVFDAGRGQSNE
ncbi:MAG TPA: hypothetical protein PLD23_19880 [Armatimonadota bacterium]|nr:hypothetical protein [Armatimonadota bacterium]